MRVCASLLKEITPSERWIIDYTATELQEISVVGGLKENYGAEHPFIHPSVHESTSIGQHPKIDANQLYSQAEFCL